jgi:hypothetical protein
VVRGGLAGITGGVWASDHHRVLVTLGVGNP